MSDATKGIWKSGGCVVYGDNKLVCDLSQAMCQGSTANEVEANARLIVAFCSGNAESDEARGLRLAQMAIDQDKDGFDRTEAMLKLAKEIVKAAEGK